MEPLSRLRPLDRLDIVKLRERNRCPTRAKCDPDRFATTLFESGRKMSLKSSKANQVSPEPAEGVTTLSEPEMVAHPVALGVLGSLGALAAAIPQLRPIVTPSTLPDGE